MASAAICNGRCDILINFKAKAGGGSVLMPTAGPINVPLAPKTEANYNAFIEAGLEFGRY